MSKSTYLIIAASLLLGGCGHDNTQPATPKSKETQNVTETKKEETTTDVGQAKATTTPAEKEVDTPVAPPIIYRVNPNNWGINLIDGSDHKGVLLTIDDAPDKHSLEMAKTLQRLGVKAIFFVNGHFLDSPEEEAVLKEIYEMGFSIGNHTYSHSMLKELTLDEQKLEILSLNERVLAITGEKPKFFRAPFGVNTDTSHALAASEKMLVMNWTYGYDWEKEYQNGAALTDIMVNTPYLKNGANLLMHDREWTNEALEGIVKGLQEKGYTMIDPAQIEAPL